MSQFQRNFLSDFANVNPTVRPIDTYYQPTQRGVAGPPIGENPATQIAKALGRFDQGLQQYYFQPQHEKMVRQAEVDAQTYKDRYDNFQSFSKAVASGEIHQGDNPWLQVYTKELYAKDAANDLSIKIAGLSDRQDLLGAEDPGAAFDSAVAELQGEILGSVQDPYMRMAFQRFSEPVVARGANQFAQGVRNYNIQSALTALETDINRTLNEDLAGFSTADEATKQRMLAELSSAASALAVESNLLTKQQVNATIGKSILGYIDGIANEDPRTAANMLEMFGEFETQPGSYLGDSTAFVVKKNALQESIENRLVKDSDDHYREKQKTHALKRMEMRAAMSKVLRDVDDYSEYSREEAEAAARQFEAEYGEYVDDPYATFLSMVDKRAAREDAQTSEAVRLELADQIKGLNQGRYTPQEVLDWADTQDDLSLTDYDRIESYVRAAELDGQQLDRWTRDQMNLSMGTNSVALLEAFGDQVQDFDTGAVSVKPGPRYQAKLNEVTREIQLELEALEEDESFQGLTNVQKSQEIEKVVKRVYDSHMPEVPNVPAGPSPADLDTQRSMTTNTKSGRSTRDRIKAEITARDNVNTALQADLDAEVERLKKVEADVHKSVSDKLNRAFDVQQFWVGNEYGGPGYHSPKLGISAEVAQKNLYELSMQGGKGSAKAREFLYRAYKKSIASANASDWEKATAEEYRKLLDGIDISQIRLFDSMSHGEEQFAQYEEIKANPELLNEKQTETFTIKGGFFDKTHTIDVYPYRQNIFYMIEEAYGTDLTDPANAQKRSAFQKAQKNLIKPPTPEQ